MAYASLFASGLVKCNARRSSSSSSKTSDAAGSGGRSDHASGASKLLKHWSIVTAREELSATPIEYVDGVTHTLEYDSAESTHTPLSSPSAVIEEAGGRSYRGAVLL